MSSPSPIENPVFRDPDVPMPCCICGQGIGPMDSYGIGKLPGHRYHWECIRQEAAVVAHGTEFVKNMTQ